MRSVSKLYFFVLGFIFTISSLGLNAQHKELKAVDKNGYEYVYFDNDPTNLRIYTLNNGLKVYLSQNTDKPEIVTSIAVKAGSNNDPRNSTGLAHYFEHMMFKGTSSAGTSNWKEEKKLLKKIEKLFEKRRKETDPAKRDEIYAEIDKLSYEASKYAIAGEYDRAVTMLGASGTNAYTSYDETVYVNNIPSNELERWLHLEADRFSDVKLRVFHTELETVYEEYNRGIDNNMRSFYMTTISEGFKGSNYSTSVLGKPEHLKNPSMTDIYQFHKDYYVPNNMAIILNGDLKYEETVLAVEKEFGKLKPNRKLAKLKEKSKKEILKVEPLNNKVVKLQDPEIEKLIVAFRYNPRSNDDKMISLINLLLGSKIGLFNTDINQAQKLMMASPISLGFKYYGLYGMLAIPKPGQSLDDAKQILLAEVEKVKKGDFDYDIIKATLNNLKIDQETAYENNGANNKRMINDFIKEKNWGEMLGEIDDLYNYSKEDIVAFANKFFTENNMISVYKEKGEKKVEKVSKPKITPVVINRDSKSKMLKELESMPVSTEILPVDPDFSKIGKEKLGNIDWYSVENTRNRLFSLRLKFDIGSLDKRFLDIASSYISLLGTENKSLAQINREFYNLAITKSVGAGSEDFYIVLSGLSENMEEGMALLADYINNLKADDAKLQTMIENEIKARNDAKVSPERILSYLSDYALYGESSILRIVDQDEELRALKAQDMVDLIKAIKNYKFEVYYYGKENQKAKDLVSKYFNTNGEYASVDKFVKPTVQDAKGVIYFVNKEDMLQVQFSEVGKLYKLNDEYSLYQNAFNDYFGSGLSSIVFQEIRESRSLAYSSYAIVSAADEKDRYNVFKTFIGTQPDKFETAYSVLGGLLNEMPLYEKAFNGVKGNIVKKYAKARVSERSLFPYYESIKKEGGDFNKLYKYNYEKAKEMSLDGLKNFYETMIKVHPRDIVIVGNKAELDLEKLSKEKGMEVKEVDVNYLFNY